MNTLFSEKVFYHIYPLGMCGCPARNDFSCSAGDAFGRLEGELGRIASLGVNALYIGPVFESTAHGYDTVDYFHVDRRLGNNESFAHFCDECHKRNISVVLDAVFNHTGRDFFAFKDVQRNSWNSAYKDWYKNLNFSSRSCYGDCFDYEGWAGCKDLVTLSVDNPQVREHLFAAVDSWIKNFNIDGLRLDAADKLSKDFLDALSAHCKAIRNDFWLMGEVVYGDYNDWTRTGRLDSVTNYQLYKALWSSLNDKNMYELSYNLNREYGEGGMYNSALLYNFLDNHDVNRIASTVGSVQNLYLVYALLFCVPGIPSIYYGSEWALRGKRDDRGDSQLRPPVAPFASSLPEFARPAQGTADLMEEISRFAKVRREHPALQKGSYHQLHITNETFAFSRRYQNEEIVVVVNCDTKPSRVVIDSLKGGRAYEDLLNGGNRLVPSDGALDLPASWLRVLRAA